MFRGLGCPTFVSPFCGVTEPALSVVEGVGDSDFKVRKTSGKFLQQGKKGLREFARHKL